MSPSTLNDLFKNKVVLGGIVSLLLSILSLFVLNNLVFFVVFLVIFIILLLFNFIKITRKLYDTLGSRLMLFVTASIIFLFFLLLIILIQGSLRILSEESLPSLLFSSTWKPFSGEFGLFAVIIDTLIVTAISMLIAVPISLLSAIYIAEYAPKKFKNIVRPFIDVLAGVPSVVFGLCALLVFVPIVRDDIAPFFGSNISSGFSLFTAALILAIMVFPIIISLCLESFNSIPIALKEASLSVGATKWETVKKVIFRASGPGILAAIFLGFGRAFGETIAVSMVIGNQELIPSSLFGPGQTLASLIASNYTEVSSIPILASALIFVALLLFIVVLIFNLLGYLVLRRASKRWKY
ncbi:MAG: phosphate ABC transporter permease subunit PstC [Candidatus Thermoplasmatota archaeon]|jgi:phosphate transport system permease protein|nr:phosphate ABC transporter permease subunit PstC [Candidatus Thermoplasmatota archaeon]